MKQSLKNRLEKLEKKSNIKSTLKKIARILHDPDLPQSSRNFKFDANVALILPDNGRRGPSRAPKGSYSVFYN